MEEKLIIKNESNDNITILNYNDLDFGFGLGDYFYNGNCVGLQLGFCWDEEKGQKFIEHIYCNVYIGNEKTNDLLMLNKILKNIDVKELHITLSNDDYKTFRKWHEQTNRQDFKYFNDKEIKELEY